MIKRRAPKNITVALVNMPDSYLVDSMYDDRLHYMLMHRGMKLFRDGDEWEMKYSEAMELSKKCIIPEIAEEIRLLAEDGISLRNTNSKMFSAV